MITKDQLNEIDTLIMTKEQKETDQSLNCIKKNNSLINDNNEKYDKIFSENKFDESVFSEQEFLGESIYETQKNDDFVQNQKNLDIVKKKESFELENVLKLGIKNTHQVQKNAANKNDFSLPLNSKSIPEQQNIDLKKIVTHNKKPSNSIKSHNNNEKNEFSQNPKANFTMCDDIKNKEISKTQNFEIIQEKKFDEIDKIFVEDIAPEEETFLTSYDSRCSKGPKAVLKLDPYNAKHWLYLTGNQFRRYQFDITKTCLFNNTIVSIPTGLGKTFIATNVILNYYLWFGNGKIFFLAPTKPLVKQQRMSIDNTKLIKKADVCELTGDIKKKDRKDQYHTHRIFFATPQTIKHDLIDNHFIDPKSIVLIIFDETHKCVGDYAYNVIIKKLHDSQNGTNKVFGTRLIGLTATPGSEPERIKEIVSNSKSSRLEHYNSTDPRISKYFKGIIDMNIYIKQIDKITQNVKYLDGCMKYIIGQLANILTMDDEQKCIKSLKNRITWDNIEKLKKSLIKNKDYYDKNLTWEKHHRAWVFLRLILSFIHKKKSLQKYGFAAFSERYKSWYNLLSAELKIVINELLYETDLKIIHNQIFTDSSLIQENDECQHPKVEKLSNLLQEFFQNEFVKELNSKVLVFIDEKVNIQDIVERLKKIDGVKVHFFVGQNKQNGSIGMKQRDQDAVLQAFRENVYNTLICTCVAEEGLDIDEVDLVINYDVATNATRYIQRRGRTGRKREGRSVNLLLSSEIAQYNKAVKGFQKLCQEMNEQSKNSEATSKILFDESVEINFEENGPDLFGDYQINNFNPKLKYINNNYTSTTDLKSNTDEKVIHEKQSQITACLIKICSSLSYVYEKKNYGKRNYASKANTCKDEASITSYFKKIKTE